MTKYIIICIVFLTFWLKVSSACNDQNCLTCDPNVAICTVCKDNTFYLKTDSCVSCSNLSNCLECTDATTCTKCTGVSTYYLSGTKECVACSTLSDCVECSDATTCTKCNTPSFYLANKQCVACSTLSNCLECSDATACTKCTGVSTYYLSGTKECVACSTLSNCVECSDVPTCTKCNTPSFYLGDTNQCVACSTIGNCLECSDSTTCTKCNTPTFYLGESKQCLACSTLTNCLECSGSTTCTKCSSIYFPKDGICTLCSTPLTGCSECQSDQTCSKCTSPAYYLAANNICVACSSLSNCLECSGVNTCTKCKDSTYYSKNGVCTLCSSALTGCSECSSETACTKCNAPTFYLGANSQCTACTTLTSCLECSDSNICSKCVSNLFFISSEKICTSCSSTLTGCQECTDSSICTKCVANTFYKDGDVCKSCTSLSNCKECSAQDKCSICLESFYADPTSGSCQSCDKIANCEKCSPDSKTCLQCKATISFLKDAACVLCTDKFGASCLECSETKCLKCDQTKLLDKLNGSCVDTCPADTTVLVGELGKEGVCEPCSTSLSGCLKCDAKGEKCTACQVNLFLSLSKAECVEQCKAKEEFETTDAADQAKKICQLCQESDIKNCGECTTKSSCQQCDTGYFPIFGETLEPASVGPINECKKCSDVTGLEGCSECSTNDSNVQVCGACQDGYWFDTVKKSCVKCLENCAKCTQSICSSCAVSTFLLLPTKLKCSACDNVTSQIKIKLEDQSEVCSFAPLLNESRILNPKIVLGISAAVMDSVCIDSVDNSSSSKLQVAYACGLVQPSLESLSIESIKAKIPKEKTFSDPDYNDLEAKFFGYTTNNTLVCPGKADSDYSLVFYCINEKNQTVLAKQKYSTPEMNSTKSVIQLSFSTKPSSDKQIEILCGVEEILGLKGKNLVKTQEGLSCNITTARRRILQTAYSMVILVEQDPFQPSVNISQNVIKAVNSQTFLTSLSSKISGVSITGAQGFEVPVVESSTGIVPDFSPATSIVHTKNTTSISFTFRVNNTDATLWIGYIRSDKNADAPKTLASLKISTVLDRVLSTFLPKNQNIMVVISDLAKNTEYNFYFSAESFLGGNQTGVFETKLITPSDFSSNLKVYMLSSLFLVALILSIL